MAIGDERCYFQVGFVPTKTKDSAFKASLSDSSLMSVSYTMKASKTLKLGEVYVVLNRRYEGMLVLKVIRKDAL